MPLILIYSQEQVLEFIKAVELLSPSKFQDKQTTLKELVKFRITSQEEAQRIVTAEEPFTWACGCMGGPEGCSFCNCQLVHLSYLYRYHIYFYYFYKEEE